MDKLFEEAKRVKTETSLPSDAWLAENNLASLEEYLTKLRIIKREILNAIDRGYLIDTTKDGECNPENQHHFHEYSVPQEKLGHVNVNFLIHDVNKSRSLIEAKSIRLGRIHPGHPCAMILVANQWKGSSSVNLAIDLVQLERVSIHYSAEP